MTTQIKVVYGATIQICTGVNNSVCSGESGLKFLSEEGSCIFEEHFQDLDTNTEKRDNESLHKNRWPQCSHGLALMQEPSSSWYLVLRTVFLFSFFNHWWPHCSCPWAGSLKDKGTCSHFPPSSYRQRTSTMLLSGLPGKCVWLWYAAQRWCTITNWASTDCDCISHDPAPSHLMSWYMQSQSVLNRKPFLNRRIIGTNRLCIFNFFTKA